jgi:hypothetical protein
MMSPFSYRGLWAGSFGIRPAERLKQAGIEVGYEGTNEMSRLELGMRC